MHELKQRLVLRKQDNNLRFLKKTRGVLVDFASNDTLGISQSPLFHAQLKHELETQQTLQNRFGSTGSRLLTGNSEYAEKLEKRIARFHEYESALLFNCGYMANSGLISAIAKKGDFIFFDAGVHASTRESLRLTEALSFPFKHNDVNHLEKRLKNAFPAKNRFICLESLYSTDGTLAPLENICDLANRFGAKIIIDEAHATGIIGPQGKGLAAEKNLTPQIFAQIVTFGKALGTFGAAILGSSLLIQNLINFSHSFIYTTALPFPVLAAVKCSYQLFPKLQQEREHIQDLITTFREKFFDASPTAIQPFCIKGNKAVKEASKYLQKEGFDVKALTSPTIRKGEEKLRICLHAFNTQNELSNLLEHLEVYA